MVVLGMRSEMSNNEGSLHSMENGISEERSATSKKELDDPCEMCTVQRSKYNCPGCYTRTCSFPCVQLHKVKLGCDGVAKRTKMVTMEHFDALTLLSDYRFLEEAKQVASKTIGHLNGTDIEKREFKKTQILVTECKKRGIRLEISPWGMDKSVANTSAYNPVAETIFWRIEWVFVDAGDYTAQTDKNPESVKLDTLLRQFVKARHGCELLIPSFNDDVRFAKYRTSVNSGSPLWNCYLKCERNGWTKDTRYYKLENSKSICDNIAGKIVIEFPTIYVACSGSNGADDPRFPLLTDAVRLSLLSKRVWERRPTRRSVDEQFRLMDDLERPVAKPIKRRTHGSNGRMAGEIGPNVKPDEKQAKTANHVSSSPNGNQATQGSKSDAVPAPMQPLRRLIRSQPPNPSYNRQGPRQHDGNGKKPPWNPFAAKRVGKRQAIDDLAVALSTEPESQGQTVLPKLESPVKTNERRYADVYVDEKCSTAKKEDKKNDYFSLLGFHYASSDGDSDLEEGEIR